MKLLIRADASIQMGTGHLMRCLALAQAVKAQGGSAYFAIVSCPSALLKRLENEGFTIYLLDSIESGSSRDAQETADLFQNLCCQWICVDGYQFSADYQQRVKGLGCRSLFLDDYGHASFYSADLILNQNISAHDRCYQHRHFETELLLGTRYTLLRQEFLAYRKGQRRIPNVVRNILITLGGSDPKNVTTWILDSLQTIDIPGLTITIIIGAANPHRDSLEACVMRSIYPVQLVWNATNMPDYIAAADLAISAGGSTIWELLMLGLPNIIVTLADNQVAIAQSLHEQEVSVSLGSHNPLEATQLASVVQKICISVEQRQRMSAKGQDLIDGDGCDRVLMAMKGDTIRLRPAKWQDCEQIWQWANEAITRKSSFQSAAISWEQHVRWFKAKVQNVTGNFWIALDRQDQPIGQVRFDPLSTETTQISLSLDRNYRHQGLGKAVLKAAIRKIFCETAFLSISAWIKLENIASISVFESVQFVKIETEYKEREMVLHYQLRKPMREEIG